MKLIAMSVTVFLRILLTACLPIILSACNYRGEPVSPTPMHQPVPVPVELTTMAGDQQTFVEGDEIQFLLSLGSDAYVYMYHEQANGVITQLIPSVRQKGHYYAAGYFMTLPEYVDGYRFVVSAPLGEQSVWLFASNADLTSMQPGDTGEQTAQELTIEDLRRRIKRASDEYGEARLLLKTVGSE